MFSIRLDSMRPVTNNHTDGWSRLRADGRPNSLFAPVTFLLKSCRRAGQRAARGLVTGDLVGGRPASKMVDESREVESPRISRAV